MLVSSSLSSPPLTLPREMPSSLSQKDEEGTTEFFVHKPSPPPRTQSPPHPTPLPPPPHRDGSYDCTPLPPSLLPGHPREGQSASLLGGKYLLLEEMEGASLHRCLHIETNQEYVCKVRPLFYLFNKYICTVRLHCVLEGSYIGYWIDLSFEAKNVFAVFFSEEKIFLKYS